jgi:arsenate reductase (glutaredoxin)
MSTIIYYNPSCGTARNTLALIREAGIEPQIIEYLKTPPARDDLKALIARANLPARTFLREKEALATELALNDPAVTDDQIIDAIATNPILLNRPIVVTPRGVKVCRPAELVKEILP